MDIHIPQHCSQEWDKMKPTEKGRFCDVCSTFVVDFSKMTREEILDYKTKTEGKFCARISTYQLTASSIQQTNIYLYQLKTIKKELGNSFNYLYLQGYIIDNQVKGIKNAQVDIIVLKNRQKQQNDKLSTYTDCNGKFSFYLPIAITYEQYNEKRNILNRKSKCSVMITKEGFEKYITDIEIQCRTNQFIKLNTPLTLRTSNIKKNSIETMYGLVFQDIDPYILTKTE